MARNILLLDIEVNPQCSVTALKIGVEGVPLIIIDDFIAAPEQLVELACSTTDFTAQPDNFYPGVRHAAPKKYGERVSEFCQNLDLEICPELAQAESTFNVFSITSTHSSRLRPIQMLPHFDTPEPLQFAMVHYLCDEEHGGTSFYHHRELGYERISPERLVTFRQTIKQQAMASQLHLSPQYINGDTALFKRTHQVNAKFNRAIIYPSNILHSGDIRSGCELPSHPRDGRLTLNALIAVS